MNQPWMKRRCTATTRDGRPCRAWAVRGSDPPRCASHGGVPPEAHIDKRGEPPAHRALPDEINQVIHDLAVKQARLSRYINGHVGDLQARDLVRLFRIHGENASRIGRLLRDRRALSGDATDGIAGAIAQALDELATELESDL